MDVQRNLTMLTDFYEITMSNGYFKYGLTDRIAVFDMFFRKIPDDGGFALFAGLEQLIDYLKNLRFTPEDIEYLRDKGQFSEDFLHYLEGFRFSCDVWAVREGTPVFPYEPVVIVKGPIIQAQLIETMVLLTLNHQSLVATKASRVCRAAQGRAVSEFGSRRAQSYDAAILGARAAYIGGCVSTACALADRDYGVPATGTMAHSWVQVFDTEYEAFKNYALTYPGNSIFLVDTYNVVKSGIPNAIQVAREVLEPMGQRLKGVRIDSGDIAYLSKKARSMLDEAGMQDCKIMASNSLDEYIIRDLLVQGAQVDLFGVGENLITSKSDPVFGGVYKLAAVEKNGILVPRIKVSESIEKITTPCFKDLYRFYNRETGQALADYVTIRGEQVDDSQPITIFDPVATWKKKTISGFRAERLLVPVFLGGQCVYQLPTLQQVREYSLAQVDSLWEEVKRFEHPHRYYVDLSDRLWNERNDLLERMSTN